MIDIHTLEMLLIVGAGFLAGGILKGATGAGAPIIVVPVMALFYDVPFAVTMFVIPNFVTNIRQAQVFWDHRLPGRFTYVFAFAGLLGAGFGTVLLAVLSGDSLLLIVAGIVFVYIAFRLAKPHWVLDRGVATRISFPVGAFAGMLQGACGISAPVSLTFMNAQRLKREEFIATISVFFAAMAVSQFPLMVWYGLMTWERFILSLVALIPLMAGMPLGARIGKRLSRETFDRIILVMLAAIGVKLLFDYLT